MEFHFLEPSPAFSEAQRIISGMSAEGDPLEFAKGMMDVLHDDDRRCGAGMMLTALIYDGDPIMGIAVAFLAGVLHERDREKNHGAG